MVSKAPVEVSKRNYIEKLSELQKELSVRMDEFSIEAKDVTEGRKANPGSGWIIHRYKTFNVDICDINSARGVHHIYLHPKNTRTQNAVLSTLEMKIVSVSSGV